MRILQRAAGFAYALVVANYEQVAALSELRRRTRGPESADAAAAPESDYEIVSTDDRDRRRRGGLRIPRA